MGNGNIITGNLERNFRAAISGSVPIDTRDFGPDINNMRAASFEEGRKSAAAMLMRSGRPTNAFASSSVSNTGIGMAKVASSGIVYTQPQFFSPIHTPINWQIPTKRKEQYQWSRYYYENEPKVATAVEFYSKFPINGFVNECSNRYVKRYFDKLVEKLRLVKWLRVMSHEVHLLGDCFPFLEIDCEKCGGRGFDNRGRACEHEGGTFKRLVILNPECAEVYSDPISPESLIAFLPNDELRTLITKRGPGHERFSKDIVKMIMSGVPIPLDNRNVSHIKYCDNGYNKYGIGMVRRLFPILAYKTKLLTAQWIIAERLILPIKVAKVGSDERPASAGDLADINSKLAQVANDPNLTLVTHHAFELDWFGASLPVDAEILTKDGWMAYRQFKTLWDTDSAPDVASVDISGLGKTIFSPAVAMHDYHFNGNMVRLIGKDVDVLVTPDHDIVVVKDDGVKKIKACDADGQTLLGIIDDKSNGWTSIFPSVCQKTLEPYSGTAWCVTTSTGTIIVRRNGKCSVQGNSGKIMQLTNEFEIISQEILDGLGVNKVLLNGEGPCFHPDVEILTENGWKRYTDVADGEKIGTFNPNNGALEYQDFKHRIVKDYDGELVQFRTSKVEMLTTTNHRMWLQERTSKEHKDVYSDWKVVPAEDVKYRSKFRACIDRWDGIVPEEFRNGITVGNHLVTNMDAFCRFIGYYVSEGYATAGGVRGRARKESSTSSIVQKTDSPITNKIRQCLVDAGIGFRETPSKIKGTGKVDPDGMTCFAFRTDVVEWLLRNIPGQARAKHIPKWIKNLPCEMLSPLLETLLDGDGSLHKNSSKDTPYQSYITSSAKLADDVMEVAMKLGYAAWISYVREEEEILVVNIPSSEIGKFPVLDTLIYGNSVEDRRKCISRIPYKGKVWCFEVPNEFLVVRMHGKPLIAGNTYNSAAIGVEVMIDKLDAWRHELSEWVEQRIYLQVAKMMGFIEKNEWGEYEYVYPKLKWNIMHLRDQQQMRTFMLQLHEKGAISTQTMLKAFDIDYNQEVELLRYERAKGAMGGPQQGKGGMGGGFGGGMPDMGGLPGGDAGGGGGDLADLGGAGGAPGGDMGGAGGAPGGDAGGGGGMGAAASSSVANIREFGGKVMKKKSREKISKYKEHLFNKKQDEASGYMRDGQGRICFTGPERELMRELSTSVQRGEIRHNIQTQFDVNAMGHHYSIDFAMPDIKLGIEVDGALFHSTEEQIHTDRQRDQKLSQLGWTILRFTDKDIENRTRECIEEVLRRIIQKETWMKQQSR